MRLALHEIAAIKECAAAVFGPEAVIRVFGSRADDSRRGGDIDLHIDVPIGQARLDREVAMTLRLQETIGEQRIDIVVHESGTPLRPIDEIAVTTGIVL